jgi:voltage-gated potassium channel
MASDAPARGIHRRRDAPLHPDGTRGGAGATSPAALSAVAARVSRTTNVLACGLRYVALLAGLTVLVGGAAFAAVEPGNSTWDGVWWAITTMTTVGYGGSPTTTVGRIITIGVLVVGIGFVAVLTGAVAQRFLASQIEDVAEVAGEVEATDAEVLSELHQVRARLDRLEARLARHAD